MEVPDASEEYAERAYHAFYYHRPHCSWEELTRSEKIAWLRVVVAIGDSVDGIYEEC
jgi:hypothetical protein